MKKLLLVVAILALMVSSLLAQPGEPNQGEVFVSVEGNTVTLTTTILWVDQFWLTLTLPSGQELVMTYGYLPNTTWYGLVMPIIPETEPVTLVDGRYLLRGLEGPFIDGPEAADELFALEFEIDNASQTAGRSASYWIYFPEGDSGYSTSGGSNRLVYCALPNTLGLEWGEYYLYGHQTVFVKNEGIEVLLYSNQPWSGTHPILDASGDQMALFQIMDLEAAPWSRCALER